MTTYDHDLMSSHPSSTCAVAVCGARAYATVPLCTSCWDRTPETMKALIRATYTPGQEGPNLYATPSEAWITNVQHAISFNTEAIRRERG